MRPRPRRLPALAVLLLAWGALLMTVTACRDRAAGPVPNPDQPAQDTAGPFDPGPSLEGADVLLITLDTLRADALGFAGNRRAATPVLDRLAAAGRVFDDAHAHNVVTLPSHANILTGLYPYQHGVRENSGFVLPDTVPTLATLLRQAGWATAAFVGAYPLDHGFGLARGFDEYDDRFPRGSRPDEFAMAERRGDQVVGPALVWWNAHRGQRRFLWIHLYDPHSPYTPPEPFAGRFRDEPYLGEVAATDAFLAPLLGPLLDGKQPALVVVTADHGEALGDHGEQTHGLFAYEATLKVPLVVWGPGIRPGRDARPARHVDILPTVLGALRLDPPKSLPGRSLLASPDPAASTYFEALSASLNRGWAPLRGLLRERRKLIELPLPELYDLAKDPQEKTNLYAEERRTARALEGSLPAESVWPPPKGAVSPEQEARLRSLGYSTGSGEARKVYTAADDPKNLVGLDRQMHQVIELYSQGRYEQAATVAREVLAERPDMTEVALHLALALRQLERHTEAVDVLEDAFRRGTPTASLRRGLGLALAEAGRAHEAVEVLQPLAETGDATTLNALGIALSDDGRHGEALAVLQRAAAAGPDDPKVQENLGIVLLRTGDAGGARVRLERALQLNPQLPIAWNTLGVARYRLGDPAGALAAWQRAVAIDPRQFDALYNLGLAAAEAGQVAEAKQALSRFVATAPPARWAADIQKARQVLAQLGG